MMAKLTGQHPDRERKVPAHPRDLLERADVGVQLRAAGEPSKQHSGLRWRQDVETDNCGVLQRR
jgi:hypothetical protein